MMYRRAYRPSEVERTTRRVSSLCPEEYKPSIDPNYVDQEGRSNLHLAILHGNDKVGLIERNIKAGSDVNAEDKNGRRGVHVAALLGYCKCLQTLIKYGAEIDVFNKDGHSPLILAARHGHQAVIKVLQHSGAYTSLTNDSGETALHYAAASGNVECAEMLIDCRAKVNLKDGAGMTPLILAASKCEGSSMVRTLVDSKARLDFADGFGRTALHWAAYRGMTNNVDILNSAGANLDVFDKNGCSPFVLAIETNHSDVLRSLIDAGCDRSVIDGLNGTALGLAALKGHNQCIQLLLDATEDPDEIGYFGMTPLMSACFESHVDTVSLLLSVDADPNQASRFGATALIKSLCFITPNNEVQRHRVIAKLIRANADVNRRATTASYFTACTSGKNCPLSFAISSGYVSLINMLLLAGSVVSCAEIRDWYSKNIIDNYFNKCDVLGPIREWKTNAQPLKHICRRVIRQSIHSPGNISKVIETLPAAPAIRAYVDFMELEHMEVQKARVTGNNQHVVDPPAHFLMAQPAQCCSVRSIEGTLLYQQVQQHA